MGRRLDAIVNFDIDNYLNPYVPRSRLGLLPRPISRFLGHRDEVEKDCNNFLEWTWAFVGAFTALVLFGLAFRAMPDVRDNGGPVVLACFGATAIIQFHMPAAPVSQPRPMIVSQIFAGVIGVGITKLFALLPVETFNQLRWLAGALSVALTSFVMGVTKTVHPPAGASALLAAITPDVSSLGWWLIPLLQLGNALFLGTALITMNVHRRYPMYWWTPADLTGRKEVDTEKAGPSPEEEDGLSSISDASTLGKQTGPKGPTRVHPSHQHTLGENQQHLHEIRITNHGIVLPEGLELSEFEKSMLEVIRWRLPEAI